MRRLIAAGSRQGNILAIVLATLVVAYLAWKVAESPSQSVQFAFNGLSVGAVYALLAMGFTLVYSTVWFFDLYYGAAAAVGAYGVFYLRSKEAIGGLYEVQNPVVNALFAAVVAGVVAWSLYEFLAPRIRDKVSPKGFVQHRRRNRGSRRGLFRPGVYVYGQHPPAVWSGSGDSVSAWPLASAFERRCFGSGTATVGR